MSELGDAFELMQGARSRFHTFRATIRDWRHHARSQQAFQRWVEETRATPYGSVHLALAGTDEAEAESPDASESILRVWVEGRTRVREEREAQTGEPMGAELAVRDGAHWWSYDRYSGATSNLEQSEVGSGIGEELEHLLDPSRLLPWADFQLLGQALVAGRPALRLLARERRGVETWPPPGLAHGADEHELCVDAERGVLLRTVTRVGGKDMQLRELLEVGFDEGFPPETFRFQPPPGEELRPLPRHLLHQLSIEEAVARAPFPIWILRSVPEGWRMRVDYVDEGERPPRAASVSIRYASEDGANALALQESRATEHSRHELEDWKPIERGGEAPAAWRRGRRAKLDPTRAGGNADRVAVG